MAAPQVRERLFSRATLSRAWGSAIAGAVALGAVLVLAWDSGGYFSATYLGVGGVVCVALGLLLLLRPPHYPLSPQAQVGLASLLGFAVWTGIATRWSPAPDTGLQDMQRALMYAGLFGLALMAAGSGRLARQLVWAVLAATGVIVLAGLVSRLFPDLIPSEAIGLAGYRLAYPLDYWNTYGTMASFGGVLCLGLAADSTSGPLPRGLAAGGAVLMGAAMYFSFSRGAWLALFVGVAMLLVLGPRRGSLLLSIALVAGATVVVIGWLSAYPALVENPTAGRGLAAEGRIFAPLLLAVAGLVGFLQWLLATGRSSRQLMASLRRVVRPVAIGLAAGLVLVVVGAYATNSSGLEGRAAAATHSASAWVSRQWDDFMRPVVPGETANTARLITARGTRSDMYRVAIDGFEADPLRGEGAGSFEVRWIRTRRVNEFVRDAHSLYLETLAELGAVGGLLLALFVGSLAVAAVRSRARPVGLTRSQTGAVAAACTVWLFHAGVDWDWQIPAFTGMVLILSATLYPQGRTVRRAVAGSGRAASAVGRAATPSTPASGGS
jgi:hypothetical protein